jgi:HPt (histidine-containing phosphotransfer) domain-containing protein
MNASDASMTAEPANLDDLFQRCLGNLDLVQRVLQAFESHFEKDLDELESALKSASLAAAAQIAHRMKGASSNVAATSLARELASMEELTRNEQVPEAFACIGRLRDEWKRFLDTEKNFAACLAN